MTRNYIGSLSLNLPSRLSLLRKDGEENLQPLWLLMLCNTDAWFAKALGKVHYLKLRAIAHLEVEVLHAACTDNLAESF